MKVVEDGMLECFPTTPITNENQLGVLDIVICSVLGSNKAIEEVIGVKLIDPERNPLVFCMARSCTCGGLGDDTNLRPETENLVSKFLQLREIIWVYDENGGGIVES
ncbi:hypothetical protein RHSIM_Rhsim12G0156700 [Rhododendron simsii]|uniref:Uncharacterized protein n=1 Tax=Rhododendron simsii TaxID=118357 RepID=A0A834G3X7_RHOSS|nr:hypothetical protein RHSIM_Rhsim12G0156700 [Rhododendron simsii]